MPSKLLWGGMCDLPQSQGSGSQCQLVPACLLCRGQVGAPPRNKGQRQWPFSYTNSLLMQVWQRRADDLAERASLGSMADTRSLDSFQSSKGTVRAAKRNKLRAPRLENLRCGDAHCCPKTARLARGQGAGAAQPGVARCVATST